MRPWQKQLFESRRELRSATFKGRFDEAKVRSLASKMSQARTELIVSRDRVRSKIYALLTPKQKVLADKLQRLFHHRRNFHRDF
jgi:Spy/CpxP family protein refolding chaperone